MSVRIVSSSDPARLNSVAADVIIYDEYEEAAMAKSVQVGRQFVHVTRGLTMIVSVHAFRRSARKMERQLQEGVESMLRLGIAVKLDENGEYRLPQHGAPDVSVPGWAEGFRVEKAGRFQWAVIATERRGR